MATYGNAISMEAVQGVTSNLSFATGGGTESVLYTNAAGSGVIKDVSFEYMEWVSGSSLLNSPMTIYMQKWTGSVWIGGTAGGGATVTTADLPSYSVAVNNTTLTSGGQTYGRFVFTTNPLQQQSQDQRTANTTGAGLFNFFRLYPGERFTIAGSSQLATMTVKIHYTEVTYD